MAVTTTNFTQGPGTLYSGAFGAVEPLDSVLSALPSSGVWTDVGGTSDGVTLEVDQTWAELSCDQIVDIPERRLTKREMTIKTNLAELTLANLALSLNVVAPTAATGTLSLEPSDDVTSSQPLYKALLFDGIAPGSPAGTVWKRRVIVRKALQTDKVSFAYKKEDQSMFTATFSCHYVSASIRPFRVIDQTA